MSSSTMEVCHWGPRYIAHGALYVHQLYIVSFVDRLLCWYGATNIPSHAASYYCCVQFYKLFLIVCRRWHFRWLQLPHCGGLTSVSVAIVSPPGAHLMKRPVFGSIRIQSHWCEVFVKPGLAGVDKVSKMVIKNKKSRGIYCTLQVTLEWMTVNLHVLLKIYSTADGWKVQGIPKVPRFAVSRSEVDCLMAMIHCSERQLKSHVRQISKGNSSTEITSGEDWNHASPGS